MTSILVARDPAEVAAGLADFSTCPPAASARSGSCAVCGQHVAAGEGLTVRRLDDRDALLDMGCAALVQIRQWG